MADIIVTTPKNQMANAAKEAAQVIENGSGRYFRFLGRRRYGAPNHAEKGDKIFYVEDGFIRGYCVIDEIRWEASRRVCQTTYNVWEQGWYVEMDATTWHWIKAIPYTGFQGWRYMPKGFLGKVEVIGTYRDKKPKAEMVCLQCLKNPVEKHGDLCAKCQYNNSQKTN